MAETGGNQSVERSLAVLQAFTSSRPQLRVSDVASVTGIGLSTVSRLLSTLESAGFVSRDPVTGLYEVGLKVLSLAGGVLNAHPVHKQARMVAQSLAANLGLGVNVAVREDDHLLYLLNFEGHLAPRSFVLTGQHSPLHATALGKSLLSGLDAAERRALLPDRALVSYTTNTVTRHEQLDREVDAVLARGYATEVEELALSRACIAAPIRNASGSTAAAVSLSGPLSAIDLDRREAELGRFVIETADTISMGLGYAHADPSAERSA